MLHGVATPVLDMAAACSNTFRGDADQEVKLNITHDD